MERLTYQHGNNHAVPNGFDFDFILDVDKKTADGITKILDRLAAYEDAGLEPQDIPTGLELANVFCALEKLKQYKAIGTVEHLSERKDAEEQGRLVRLPCKVGDTVYIISNCEKVHMFRDDDYFTGTGAMECPFENTCNIEDCDDKHVRICETKVSGYWCEDDVPTEMFVDGLELTFCSNDIGKTVFLTRESAEAALKERES